MNNHKVKILIVEDSLTQAEELKYILENNGLKVDHAQSAEAALELLQHSVPDIIISDIVMPGMDGYDFCSKVKQTEALRNVPVILLTKLSDPHDVIKGLESGADGFLVKPYNEQFLIERIRYIIQNAEIRLSQDDDQAAEVFFANRKITITAKRQQILDILLSTYENAIQKNTELIESNKRLKVAQDNLSKLNNSLEEKVKMRTRELELINEQLHIELEGRKQREEQEIILDAVPAWVFYKDKENRFVRVNEAFCKVMGASKEELEGKTLWDFFPKEEADAFWADDLEVINSGVPKRNIIEKMTSNDKVYWLQTDKIPFRDVQGNIIGIIGFTLDVTKRVENEELIRKLSTAVEQSPVSVVITNLKGEIEYVNPRFTVATGYSYQEAIGQNPRILKSGEMSPEGYVSLWKAVSSGQEWRGEFHNKRKNGELYWESASISPIKNSEGVATHFLAVKEDITQQKLALEALHAEESRLRAITDTAKDAILMMDPDGVISFANPGAEQIFGYTREEMIGKNLHLLLVPQNYHQPHSEAIVEFRKSGEGAAVGKTVEIEGLRKSGEIFPVELSLSSLQKSDGWHAVGVIRDITKRKEDERELQQSEARLRELNATKDKFFSIISHDLKTPFNSIIGISNLLIERIKDNDCIGTVEFAEMIHNTSQHTFDLLLNLLEWSRSQTGKMKFKPESIDVNGFVEQALGTLIDLAEQKEITVHSAIPKDSSVFADKDMIATVLRNLLSNAIKFTPKGGTITIAFEHKPGESRFSVSDSGVGIDKDTIEILFRIDVNHSTLGTNNEKGTGLGLLLCKEFVEKHRGKIWVESEPGKGTSFHFSIPAF